MWDLARIGQQEVVAAAAATKPAGFAAGGRGDADVHASRVGFTVAVPAQARSYCATVRSAALPALPEDGDSFVFAMVISHENQYDETMLQALNLRTRLATVARDFRPARPGRG